MKFSVIKNLQGRIIANGEYFSTLNDAQRRFVEATLPNLLRRKEAEEKPDGETKALYTRRFLQHVTGLGLINRNKPSITIVFNADMGDKHRQVAHTCEQDLDIPCGAYDCDEKILEDVLEEAFLQSTIQGITTS